MAELKYQSKFTGKEIEDILDSVGEFQNEIDEKADPANFISMTLKANNWVDNKQTLTGPFFLSSGCSYIVSPDSATRDEYNDSAIYADDVVNYGSMMFNCKDVPVIDLDVNILRLESK